MSAPMRWSSGNVHESVLEDRSVTTLDPLRHGEHRHQLGLHVGGIARKGRRDDPDAAHPARRSCSHARYRAPASSSAPTSPGASRGWIPCSTSRCPSTSDVAPGDRSRRTAGCRLRCGRPPRNGVFTAAASRSTPRTVMTIAARAPDTSAPILIQDSASSTTSGSRAAFSSTVSPVAPAHAAIITFWVPLTVIRSKADAPAADRRAPKASMVAVIQADLRPQRLEPLQVLVHRSDADGAQPPGSDTRAAAEARHQRAQHHERGPHLAHQVVGRLGGRDRHPADADPRWGRPVHSAPGAQRRQTARASRSHRARAGRSSSTVSPRPAAPPAISARHCRVLRARHLRRPFQTRWSTLGR